MPSSINDRAHAGASDGILQALAAVGGGLLFVLAVVFALVALADVVGRTFANHPLLDPELNDQISTYLGLGFAGIALLALPAALAAPFVRSGDPPLRSHSALALVPGCIIALAVSVIGIAATAVVRGDVAFALDLAYRQVASTFGSHIFLFVPAVVVLSAALGGARTPEATAAVAGPTILAAFYGITVEASITSVLVASLAPAIIAAVAIAIAYAVAPFRAVTPWVAGWVLSIGFMPCVATGLFTPTEAAGLFAIFGIVIAIPVRVLALAQPIGPILRQAGMEAAAIISCLAAVMLIATPIVFAGLPQTLKEAVSGDINLFVVAATAIAYAVLAYFATPILAMALLLPLAFRLAQDAGIDTTFAGAVLLILGMAAMMARAARRSAEAPGLGLPPAVAWTLSTLLGALAVVLVFVPKIAMMPVQVILR